jgi:hypothetical protein
MIHLVPQDMTDLKGSFEAEAKNEQVEDFKSSLLRAPEHMASTLLDTIQDVEGVLYVNAEAALRLADVYSTLYRCERIFKQLFNGLTLEEIGKTHDLSAFRELEAIRKDADDMIYRSLVAALTEEFGGDDE